MTEVETEMIVMCTEMTEVKFEMIVMYMYTEVTLVEVEMAEVETELIGKRLLSDSSSDCVSSKLK